MISIGRDDFNEVPCTSMELLDKVSKVGSKKVMGKFPRSGHRHGESESLEVPNYRKFDASRKKH